MDREIEMNEAELSRLEQTAVHEAAHAVMVYSVGFRVEEVSIVPSSGRRGRCRYSYGLDDVRGSTWVNLGRGNYELATEEQYIYNVKRDLDRRVAMVAGAGPIGTVMLKNHTCDGLVQDWARVTDWARAYRKKGKSEDSQVWALMDRVARLIGNPRRIRAIIALASALLDHSTLSGKEARRIIRRAMRWKQEDGAREAEEGFHFYTVKDSIEPNASH